MRTLLFCLLVGASASAVVELTEANFDAETKIGTDEARPTFVEFFAPWCGHCKKLAPAWEELAATLQNEGEPTAIASVDATIHKDVAARFGIRGFPSLILLRDGQMYKYKGSRAVEDLAKFVKGGYKEGPGEAAPTPPTQLAQVKVAFSELFSALVTLFKTHFAAALVLTAIAFFSGLTVGFAAGLVLAPTPAPRAPPAVDADAKKEQ
ncbi:thioredoxin-like protein [Pavlovales sp. CCMP2436]|nr:thioredoxin-like protein [Pavlovales sp. CCMP2436]